MAHERFAYPQSEPRDPWMGMGPSVGVLLFRGVVVKTRRTCVKIGVHKMCMSQPTHKEFRPLQACARPEITWALPRRA